MVDSSGKHSMLVKKFVFFLSKVEPKNTFMMNKYANFIGHMFGVIEFFFFTRSLLYFIFSFLYFSFCAAFTIFYAQNRIENVIQFDSLSNPVPYSNQDLLHKRFYSDTRISDNATSISNRMFLFLATTTTKKKQTIARRNSKRKK